MTRFTAVVLIQATIFAASGSYAMGEENPLGIIEGRLQLPDKRAFSEPTRVSLNHVDQQTYSRPDGSFTFFNVQPGVHVLDVYSQTYHFAQVRCQFQVQDMALPNCIEYTFPGAPKNAVAHPFVLTALATFEYFEPMRGFSLLSIVKNPMLLMMLFSVGMMYMMP
jgi:hypothetical protein